MEEPGEIARTKPERNGTGKVKEHHQQSEDGYWKLELTEMQQLEEKLKLKLLCQQKPASGENPARTPGKNLRQEKSMNLLPAK